jgi:hypothetical protein
MDSQAIHSIHSVVKKHHQHICFGHQDKSAISEGSNNLGHHTQLQNISISSAKSRYRDCIYREAVKLSSNQTT